ncbi:hypothetical protein F350042L8_30080 [Fusobacterium ulcerans]
MQGLYTKNNILYTKNIRDVLLRYRNYICKNLFFKVYLSKYFFIKVLINLQGGSRNGKIFDA